MQMIVQALTEMWDPRGSSRRTISMYIADHFSGLDDDKLLSYNFDRLVSCPRAISAASVETTSWKGP